MLYRITRDESGSYGSSVVGQATELPLESDFYSRFNTFLLALLKEILRSFSLESLRQTAGEIDAFAAKLKPTMLVVPKLDLPTLPKLSQVVRVKRIEKPNLHVLAPALVAHLARTQYRFPKTHVDEILDGEIRFGEHVVQEEFTNKLAVAATPVKIAAGPNAYERFMRELDVLFWLWRAKIIFAYRQFSYNPQPAYSRALRWAGNGFIGLSMFTLIFFGAPFLALELRSAVYRMTAPVVSQAEPEAKPVVVTAEPIVNPDADKQFQIKIPMIGVDAKVMANVDANNPAEYEEALKHGVAHAKGTGLPGGESVLNKTIFIFSHSTNASWNITRFNALFYSLKDLKAEDQIQIWFWGEEYWYKVVDQRIVEPNDVSFLQPQTDKEKLVLQTCWPPGTTQKRLIITAERVGVDK